MYMVNLVVQYKVKTYITDFIFKHDAQRLSQSLVYYSKTQACQKWKGVEMDGCFNTQVFQCPYQILLIRNYLGETM